MAENANATKKGWSKKKKVIVAVIVLLLIALAAWWFFFRDGANGSGNPYASAETIAKIKAGGYGKWSDDMSGYWSAYASKSLALFGTGGQTWGTGDGDNINQAYASAWLKGMDIARKPANLETFKTDIEKYLNNASLRKDDANVTVGSFLNSTQSA